MAKKSVIAGEYAIEIEDKGHVSVLRVFSNAWATMVQLAEENNFKVLPNWNTQVLGRHLAKEFGDGTEAKFNDITVRKRNNNSIEVFQEVQEGKVKSTLKDIASKLNLEVEEKWTTQQLGSKLVDYLTENKASADKILRTSKKSRKPYEDTATPSTDSNVGKAAELYKRFKESHDKLYNYYKALYDIASEKGLFEEGESEFEDVDTTDTGRKRLRPEHVFVDNEYNLVVDYVEAGIKGGFIKTEGEMPEDDRILNLHDIKYFTLLMCIVSRLESKLKNAGEDKSIEKVRIRAGVMVSERRFDFSSQEINGKYTSFDEAIFDYSDKLLEEKLAESDGVISLENHPLADKYPVTAIYVNETEYGIEDEWIDSIDKITKVEGCGIDYRGCRVFSELFSPQDKINLAFLLESID